VLGDTDMLATAAIGFEEACWRPGITDAGAVELLEEASLALGDGDSEPRVRLLAGLSRARAFVGDFDESSRLRDRAVAMARRLDDRVGLATVLMQSYWSRGDGNVEETLAMLAEARELADGLGDGDSEPRVRLLAGLSRARAFVGDFDESSRLRDRAVAMARRLDDRVGLATVLMQSYWSRGDGNVEETLAMLAEARELADGLGDMELRGQSMAWHVAGLIVLGDLEAAARELAESHALAVRLRQPFALHVAEHYASALSLCVGRLAEAEAAAHRSHEWSRLLTGRDASGVHGIQMFGIRREQGRLTELAPVIGLLAGGAGGRGGSAWRPGLAALLAELGMEDEARRELAVVRREGFEPLRASLWLGSLTYLADACAAVGDEETAALVYPELAPLAGGNVVIGHGVAIYGAADRFLGMLAATLGEHDLAVEHFDQALRSNRAMGATTWVAHTLYWYGRLLRERGRASEAGRATAMLTEAATLAERIGAPVLLARAKALGAHVHRPRLPPDELSWREVDILRLVAAGRSNREIGVELSISGHTVANHVRSILRKTGAANRTEAAGYAYRHALLMEPPAASTTIP